jgi:glutamate N-acetyltransferase/amino-acid N-acetyltransferase
MKVYKKIILPKGFKASGISAGIKRGAKPDLALIFSKKPAKAAALFTTNKIKAAHIKVCLKHLKNSDSFNALMINSGNANCFTGDKGMHDAEAIMAQLAKKLNFKKDNILIASTGIIGKSLPVDKIKRAIPLLVGALSSKGLISAVRAIMTTDTFPKIATRRINIAGKKVFICGFAKGAGMISPNMACAEHRRSATMLCFILTDASISQRALKQALNSAVEDSFHCITVDGCMSTNDTVIALANGAAENISVDKNKNFNLFALTLKNICLELAKMIIKDAEGATKFIEIKVKGAKTTQEAKKAALAVANSNLFKTAIYGKNPNFGRIVQAIGASGIDVKEKDLKIKLSPLNKKNVFVEVDINKGKACTKVYTSDLTPEYIKINAEYN